MGLFRQKQFLIAFTASFFAVGFPLWLIPYKKLNLPDALLEPGIFVVVVSALLLCAYKLASVWNAIWLVGAAVPAAVLARVIVDGIKDPTSHNLWPIAVIIATFVGFGCALPGAVAGWIIGTLLQKKNRASRS